MGTRRREAVLLVVVLVLVCSAVGAVVARAQAGSFAPLLEAGFFTITPSAGPGGAIDPDTPQVVAEGGSQAFTITPATGYDVADVEVDGGSIGAVPSYTFTNVTADHTISATFAIETFTITPSAGPHGSISPGTAQTIDYGGSQTFTITPATGYQVANVLVDGSSIGAVTSHTFTNVTANHTISATFAIETFTITSSSGANGTISPLGAQAVNSGDDLTFTITPATGYYVADVLVDGASIGPATGYTFTNVTANHTIRATFAIDTFTITPSAGANGSISPATPQTVDYGGSQTFTITPATGYQVADVLVDGASIGPATGYTFTNVTANHTIRATFAIDTFTITPTAGPNGSISPAVPQAVGYDGSQAFTITPATGYHIADVLVDGVSVGAVTGYTFTNVTANHTISATFAIDTFTITPTAGPNGSISPAVPLSVDYGGSQTFTITPETGYHVVDVLVDGASVGAVTSHTFTDVTADHTISATFALDAFTITPSAGLHGSISPATPQSVAYGGWQAFTITPAAGYYIADVLVDDVSIGPVTSHTFVDVTADHSIAVSFAPGVPTSLWIQITSSVVTYGSPTVLRGELSYVDDGLPGSPVGLGGKTVVVEQTTTPYEPSSWQPLDTRTTSVEQATLGQFFLTLSPKSPTYYRLRYTKESLSPYGGAVSEVKKVGVRPSLGRPVPPRSARSGRPFTVYGSLKPQFPAGEKTVQVKAYRYRNGRWVRVKTLYATNVDNGDVTKYRLRVKFTTRGKYRFVATSKPAGWATATTRPSRTTVIR